MKKLAWLSAIGVLSTLCSSVAAEDFERWKQAEQWVLLDTLTDLEWTRRDNLGDINWNNARQYCRTLEISGGGWQLPTLAQLSQVYTQGRDGTARCGGGLCPVSPKFYLTGQWFWASDEHEDPAGAYIMSLALGTQGTLSRSTSSKRRALCVRRRS
jgi:hypothetical protein